MTEEEYQRVYNRLKVRRYHKRQRALREGKPETFYITQDDFITRDMIEPASERRANMSRETPARAHTRKPRAHKASAAPRETPVSIPAQEQGKPENLPEQKQESPLIDERKRASYPPIDETGDQENLPERASEQDDHARPFIDESEQGYEEDTASIDEDEYPFDDDSEQDNSEQESEQPPVLPWWVGVSFLAVGLLVYLWLAQYQG